MITGIIPVAPTAFHDNEELDLDGQRRIVDFLVDAQADAICILANYSEQFSLTDSERVQVMTATLEHAAGRVPVMVTTSHYSARVASERSREAESLGASLVMLMPPFFGATMAVDETRVLEFFSRVGDGISIPIMIQDAPLSSTPLSVSLLDAISREVPLVQYAKVETPRAADKIRALKERSATTMTGIFDGEEGITLIPDRHAGAQGTMSSCVAPDQLGMIVRQFLAGQIEAASRSWEALLPLIHFENRQCGLAAAKALMMEGGILSSDRTRAPFAELAAHTRHQLLELARERDPLVLRWAT